MLQAATEETNFLIYCKIYSCRTNIFDMFKDASSLGVSRKITSPYASSCFTFMSPLELNTWNTEITFVRSIRVTIEIAHKDEGRWYKKTSKIAFHFLSFSWPFYRVWPARNAFWGHLFRPDLVGCTKFLFDFSFNTHQ